MPTAVKPSPRKPRSASVRKNAAASARPNKRGALRREAILGAAQEVFLEHGFSHASIEDVIRRVGGSKASLYSYFGSKEGLFETMVVECCAQFLRDIAIPTAVEESLEATLKAFGLRFFKLYTEPVRVKLIRTTIAEATRFPKLARQFYDNGPKRVREQLSAFFANCHTQGLMHAPDPDVAAVQFITLMKGHSQFRSLFGLSPLALSLSPRAFVDYSVQLFLYGTSAARNAPVRSTRKRS